MADQSFSTDNFRKILDLENRKGIYLEGRFFPNVKLITEKIKRCKAEIRDKKKDRIENKEELDVLNNKKKILEKDWEEKLTDELQKVSENITSRAFKIEFKKVDIPDDKPIYTVDINSPENYFVLKQLQRNVAKLFDVKQSNRSEIVSQVKFLLGDRFPKYVLRTDIKDFYENISHEKILKKINENNLLSPFSSKIIRQILNKYKEESSSNKGVPRGIGVSAYLAELYMRDIDSEILRLDEVTYYARYVDDIIIIFTPTSNNQNVDYKKYIKDLIKKKFHLKLNSRKTILFDLRGQSQSYELNYLGYKMSFGIEETKTELTEKKYKKYKERINLAFNDYINFSKINEKIARKLLIKRIRFLTGNTRLANNKRNILTGIYYSNNRLTEFERLKNLDKYLKRIIKTQINSSQLRSRLEKYGFENGFKTKRFSPFNTRELSEIMKIWKRKF